MDGALALPAPGLKPLDLMRAHAPGKAYAGNKAEAKAAAKDFEAMFLNTMFQQMFTGIDGEGPFGGSGASAVWRSMLTDQYARTFANAGGVGIAPDIYRSLIGMQEAGS
jgi:Rod binding domain-containing protein